MAEEDSDERDMMEVGLETIGVAMLAANVQDGAEMVSWGRVYKATQ